MTRPYRPFEVTVEITRTYKLQVYARTPEQAEDEVDTLIKANDTFENLGADVTDTESRILDILPKETEE